MIDKLPYYRLKELLNDVHEHAWLCLCTLKLRRDIFGIIIHCKHQRKLIKDIKMDIYCSDELIKQLIK